MTMHGHQSGSRPVSSEVVRGEATRENARTQTANQEARSGPEDKERADALPLSWIPSIAPPPLPIGPSPSPGSTPLRVGSTFKHYELIRTLGQGGMGSVFLARDIKLGRLVAIKLLREYSGDRAYRFLAEAQATALCSHENIVVLHEVDEAFGTPYMVLEYIQGCTLRDFMARGERARAPGGPDATPAAAAAPVSPSRAIELMKPVVRALVCAHGLGVVHRDLKPENILLADAGAVKVLDFGIAKQFGADDISTLAGAREPSAQGAGPTRESALAGTLPYMAPEQLRREDIGPRSDLWAVGVILFELLAGRHPLSPFAPTWLRDVIDLDSPMPRLHDLRPEVGALGDLVERCLKKRQAERIGSAGELLAELEALAGQEAAIGGTAGESPFAGLSAFQESNAARFFGRDRDVAAALGRLRNQELVAVAGPSGAGKSSFVRAGVIPAVKRSRERWEALVLRPGRRPLAALADVLAQELEEAREGAQGTRPEIDPAALLARLRVEPGALAAQLRARCRRNGPEHRILLFVDQFEELFTLGTEAGERSEFMGCLEGVADDASSPLRVMLAVRSDFLDRIADDHRTFMDTVTRGLMFLPPLGREELREAIARPLQAVGHRFESDEMLDEMLDALEGTRGPLPLLQFAATRLWEARDRARRLLTRDSYRALGGVAGALSTHADAVLSRLPAPDQRLARAILLRLVTPERTRAIVSAADLLDLAEGGGEAVTQVLHHLAGARLVHIESSGEREGTTVELVHESLIDRWAKLRRWLEENEQDAQFLSRLRAAAQQWEASGEAEGMLWRDRAAEEAAHWLKRARAERGDSAHAALARREAHYLLAVVALVRRARRTRWRLATSAIALLAATASAVSYLALRADREATRAQAEATQARNATRIATARELEDDPTTVLALVREIEPPGAPRGWSDLARFALQRGVARTVLTEPGAIVRAAFSPDGKRIVTASLDGSARIWRADGAGEPVVLRGHQDRLAWAAFSPDGRRVVTASYDRTARVWSADGAGEPIVLRGHDDVVFSAAFSPDGTRVVTASWDTTARVWSADGTGEPVVLRGRPGWMWSAAFSPDGTRVVTASGDLTARVFRADGTGSAVVLRHDDIVFSAAFSPDGSRVVTASHDKLARVWNADGTGEPIVLRGHQDAVFSASFNTDGRRVVTASWDKTARVWNADGTGEPIVLRGHQDMILSAAFSADGQRVVTASLDRTIRTWDVADIHPPLVLRGHEDLVSSVAYSPDGQRIVTASYDMTARVWSATATGEPVVLRGHTDWVNAAAFSADGRRVVTASNDQTARVWDAGGTAEPIVLREHLGPVNAAAFSPDDQHIVTGSQDGTVRVHSADGASEPLVLRGHTQPVQCVAYSPDGQHVASASWDTTVRVWDAGGDVEQPVVLRGHQDRVNSVAFSPDGERIVTASWDKTIRVWNADGAGEPLVLRGHVGVLHSAAFSPDGRRIVSVSDDRTIRVWNADGAGEPLVLRGHELSIKSAAFSPNGARIVTGSDDRTARVWTDLETLRGVDDPKLWTSTTYCMPVERRMELLHISEATARADRDGCLRRVDEASAASLSAALLGRR
ncbi:protein kinase [Sorangium sp. So ce302]|uniref:nSTAND1 domain-containing NTPase n=1 Tax=Sorangium sp. So ce302 TaxID=3133297 RepID=UPI003F62CA14